MINSINLKGRGLALEKLKLVEERESLLNEIESIVFQKTDIKACFLGGSLARNNADEYSDIDFRIVIEEYRIKKDVLSELIKIFNRKIAFIETLTSFYAVIHFSNFIKLDIFVYYPQEIVSNIWFKDILILKDHNDLLTSVKEKSKKIDYQVKQIDFDNHLNKYSAYLHELYRRLKRKEDNYSEQCTLMMKHLLISLWLMEKGHVPNDLGDWSKYEGNRSKLNEMQKSFISQYTPISFGEIDQFINQMNYEFCQVGRSISNKYNLSFNEEKYDFIVSLVDFKL